MKKAISSKKRKINDFFISRGWLKFCEKISEGISLVSFPIHKNDDNALAGLPLFIENNYAYSTINEILFGKAAGKLRHLGISFLPSLTCFSPYSDFNVAYAMNKAGSSDLINALIEKMSVGDTAQFVIERDGNQKTISLVLEEEKPIN